MLSLVGLDPSNFSTHPFQTGGASWTNIAGVPKSVIKVMGDWQSSCYIKCINCPLHARVKGAILMKSSLIKL